MIIGIPVEIKDHEYRVGATPQMVKSLVEAGHQVLIQSGAGARIGYADQLYVDEGGRIVSSAQEAYAVDMIVKVKEPLREEFPLLREGQILFCFLHLAPDRELTDQLIEKKVIAIACETVMDAFGRLPILIPMSAIAGRIAIQSGARGLELINGGKGVVLGGIAGVLPAKVVILGGGVLGTEAARMAIGLGADTVILDKNIERLRQLDLLFGPHLKTVFSTSLSIKEEVRKADLVIGAVLIPGKTAPKLISKVIVESMSPGSVIVDAAIDQGGCAETSRPTTHTNPFYITQGVVHYCVTNMPGACARTATEALTNATMGYVLKLADKGYKLALLEDSGLRAGLNIYKGRVTNEHVAKDLGYEYFPAEQVL
jgi:alanine dehydrogenase